MNLFDYADTYPVSPGWKGTDTSHDAAVAVASKAQIARHKIFNVIALSDGLTADEACARAGLDILTGRPRCSELKLDGLIVDSGLRRALASGRSGVVWRVAS